jgi:hypothetical protein
VNKLNEAINFLLALEKGGSWEWHHGATTDLLRQEVGIDEVTAATLAAVATKYWPRWLRGSEQFPETFWELPFEQRLRAAA